MQTTISLDALQKIHGNDVDSELGLKTKGTAFSHTVPRPQTTRA